MGYSQGSNIFKLGPWAKGINNVKDEAHLFDDELRDAENFVLNDLGIAETRPGLIKRVSATSAQGLYQVSETYAVYFDEGTLYRLDITNWSTTSLATGYTKGRRISWAMIGPRLFFTNGSEHGRIHIPTWAVLSGFGTADPNSQVSLSTLSHGGLCAGRYFIAITHVDLFGEESAATNLHFRELTAAGGIGVTLAGTPPAGVVGIRIYASDANGNRDEMYRVAELDASDTYYEFTDNAFGSPLETLFLNEIPVPDMITTYNGHLYFSIDQRVWYSETMRYGLYHIDHNELYWFPETVNVLEGGRDSVWVVADKTYAFVGDHPKDFNLMDDVFNHSAARFSGTQIEGSLFSEIGSENVPFWFSTRGAVIGIENGKVLPLMKDRAEPDKYGVGASGTVEFNGVKSVMTALDNYSGPNDSVTLQDSFSVTVVNRGITET